MLSDRDERAPRVRVFVAGDLGEGRRVEATQAQAHYLCHVMRRGDGDPVRVFNGRDGEWLARLRRVGRNALTLSVERLLRDQTRCSGPWLAFAPVKKAATDLIVEKATELGAARLMPIVTQRTVVERVRTDRLRAVATEAAEQCGRLSVPDVAEPVALDGFVEACDRLRPLLIADPDGRGRPVFDALIDLAAAAGGVHALGPCFAIGPEGGFTSSDLDLLAALPSAKVVSLGPRILRAETAAISALACWQAIAGDWRGGHPNAPVTPPSGAR